MIVNQPDGSKVEQEEPESYTRIPTSEEVLESLKNRRDTFVLSPPTAEESLSSIAESLRLLANRYCRQEQPTARSVSDLRMGPLNGMTYRGYSMTELDTMIDFYMMHRGPRHGER